MELYKLLIMMIEKIISDPEAALVHLDRYVNDGSPSGFTEINKTSHQTDTFSPNPFFTLYKIEASPDEFEIYGQLTEGIPLLKHELFIHPDMTGHLQLRGINIQPEHRFSVSPTSSFRTVKIVNHSCRDYVKLHYDKILGRINRKLNRRKAISGVEISNELTRFIDSGKLSSIIAIYQEPFAKIFQNPLSDPENSWGMVWRKEKPFGPNCHEIAYIIPLFSFWSADRKSLLDACFGMQLFSLWGDNSKMKLINQLLIPLLDCYFELLIKIGLQNEYNAQNLLIGIDHQWNIVSIINRDMMGMEKDLPLREALGLATQFDSTPYKSLAGNDPLYQTRHSFIFDFKVCEYVILPLIDLAADAGVAPRNELLDSMIERTAFWLKQLPADFFPKGRWYSHPKIDISIKANRIYHEHSNPPLRK